ncbi:MAG TPA: alpha/beta hydrolase [Pseudonocardiaceae bacterium]
MALSRVEESYLDELSDLVLLHARAQGITPARCREVLARIHRPDGEGPGCWPTEWSAEAAGHAERGQYLTACRYYNLARFPYPDGPARVRAASACVQSFQQWCAGQAGIHRWELPVAGGRVVCLVAGLSREPRPLLLVSGGIVSIKEQWTPFLLAARRLGMAVVVAEMPSVGENTLRYGASSWRMLPALLDGLAPRVAVEEVYAVAISFSGHLAIRAALEDPRLRGVVTLGAPVRSLFTDRSWWQRLPQTTTRTLAHLTGVPRTGLFEHLEELALRDGQLAGLDIPVAYLASARDEIIPRQEWELLSRSVRRLDLMEFDDVHGSPGHLPDIRLWIARSLLRMRQCRAPVRAGLSALLGVRAASRRALRWAS